jgi:tetratricopeptide (TPR) repeat protein
MRTFFVSRTDADKEWAQWIAQELEDAGHSAIVQDWDSRPGHDFVEFMEKGAEFETIAVISPDYWSAVFTKPEVRAAFAAKTMIPVRVRECATPKLYAQHVFIDFVGKSRDEARQLLIDGIKRERVKREVEFPGESGDAKISIGKLPTVNSLLVGREAELKLLDEAWTNPKTNLVSIVAFGGVGKTSLAINWWHRNQAPGAKRVLGWSFYSQGAAEDRQASAEPFLEHALREWFGVTDPPLDSWTRGERLAKLLQHERTLLILDGLEPIQFPPGPHAGHFKDPGMEALLRELSIHNPGLCLCTSRLALTDLDGPGIQAIDLDNLTPETGAQYLQALKVNGPEEELQRASADFDNHALALTLLGNLLVKRYHGRIEKRDTIPTVLDEHQQGAHARRVLREYEVLFRGKPELEVLRILGLFDRPADKGALKILRKLKPAVWAGALENLKDARLIEYTDPEGALDCHPLIREHFADEYQASSPDAFRAAQEQLYEYYSKLAPQLPDTLEEMAPLFYAVYHGCQAGKHQEALDTIYYERILHGDETFLVKQLGAFGVNLSLVANFFITPWHEPVPSLSVPDQSWVTGEAASALRALGRLREAVEPLRAAVEERLRQESWSNAARNLMNLSDLHLALGDVSDAIDAARRSVEAADKGGDGFLKEVAGTKVAAALHQSGELDKAAALFQEAEKMHTERQPQYPVLYSVQGYRYCDLLLERGESAEVLRRGKLMFEWRLASDSLLTIALEHLSLGRARPAGSAEAAENLEQAVSGLRRAGDLDQLPRGLLARAAHFRHTHKFEKAQHDLDEVRVLATRCGMRLFLTDYHLEQARLLLAQGKPAADARPHYEAAKKLIEDTGYHRRDPELADLEKQLQ